MSAKTHEAKNRFALGDVPGGLSKLAEELAEMRRILDELRNRD